MRFLSLLCPQVVTANDLARTVYSGIPDDVIFNDYLFILGGRPGFHLDRGHNKMSSSESTASDMSDLSYEQGLGEIGECGEIDEGPLQHCRKLTTYRLG
jgi:hypothetical protein